MSEWLIYGATGYTGELIAREAVRLGLSPVVAGRNALAVESLGKELGLRARVIALDDPATIASNLAGIALVLNCAGPFSQTAEPIMQACLTRRAHYLDITGESTSSNAPMRSTEPPKRPASCSVAASASM